MVRRRIPAALFFVPIILIGSWDLMLANRHFLFSFPWEKYQREFLAPNFLDLWLMEEDRGWSYHDTVSEQSLRPILFGRRSLLGYHPISYAAMMDGKILPPLRSPKWMIAHGIRLLGAPLGSPDALADFPDAGRSILRIGEDQWGAQRRVLPWKPNEMRFFANRGMDEAGRIHGAFPPGMVLEFSDRSELLKLPGFGTWISAKGRSSSDETIVMTVRYRPSSWKVGLFLGAVGAAILAFVCGYSKSAVPTRTMLAPSSMATSKSPVMPMESSGSG
jgi:hypothetical protein